MGIWDIRLGRVCISMAVWLPVTMGVTADPVLLLLLLNEDKDPPPPWQMQHHLRPL